MSEALPHKVNSGGLFRCCLQTLGEVPEDKLSEYDDGDVIECKHCDQSMIVHQEDDAMIWRWHRTE